ncbi:MAG TPA: FadR/GntR family transcriptional regulator [Desulfotignum sp.]|nr:FadR/GntR family transcriptional regulator [Desulfotignum sp.]
MNEPKYQRVKTKTVSEEIVEQIKTLIKESKIEPGEQLPPERRFAEMLGVGRPTLREALNHLAARGFLEIRNRQGVFVKNISTPLVSDTLHQIFREDRGMLPYLYEVRKDIELAGAYLAAERRTDEDLALIEFSVEKMEAGLASGSVAIADDIGFHIAIARSTHNFLRVHLLRHLFDISGEFLDSVLRELAKAHTNLPSVVAQHRRVLEAIRQQDPPGAREEMQTHLGWVQIQWQAILNAGRQ